MSDHVVDTNVLLVASAAHPYSPFDDTHVPAKDRQVVLDWLIAFQSDRRKLVLDCLFAIYHEYHNKLTGQDIGLMVIDEKLRTMNFRQVKVVYESDGTAHVPDDFRDLDRSDRKFLAAALADGGKSTIVNAADPDWFAVEDACRRHGVVVEHLIEEWLRRQMRT